MLLPLELPRAQDLGDPGMSHGFWELWELFWKQLPSKYLCEKQPRPLKNEPLVLGRQGRLESAGLVFRLRGGRAWGQRPKKAVLVTRACPLGGGGGGRGGGRALQGLAWPGGAHGAEPESPCGMRLHEV